MKIRSRLNDGFTVGQLKKVIDAAIKDIDDWPKRANNCEIDKHLFNAIEKVEWWLEKYEQQKNTTKGQGLSEETKRALRSKSKP